MKTLTSFSAVAAIALLTLWLGCTDSPTDSRLDQIPAISKQEPSGGTDSEIGVLPSFPTSIFTLLDQRFDVFVVRLVWGSSRDSSALVTPAVNWSGSLSINGVGALWVRRTIGFEEGQDHLLPRTAFHTVNWRSITDGDRDGIESEIYLRNDVVYIMEPRLWFETEPLAVTFSFEQLKALDTVITVDGVGALSVRAHKFERVRCPHGPLGGSWKFLHEGDGKFEGRILLRGDIPIGKLAGRFFTTDGGERLFAGRWKTLEGIFSGQVRGRWEFNPVDSTCSDCRKHTGRFKGEFFSSDGSKLGNLHGRFGAGSDSGLRGSDAKIGRFKGFWGVECDRDGAE